MARYFRLLFVSCASVLLLGACERINSNNWYQYPNQASLAFTIERAKAEAPQLDVNRTEVRLSGYVLPHEYLADPGKYRSPQYRLCPTNQPDDWTKTCINLTLPASVCSPPYVCDPHKGRPPPHLIVGARVQVIAMVLENTPRPGLPYGIWGTPARAHAFFIRYDSPDSQWFALNEFRTPDRAARHKCDDYLNGAGCRTIGTGAGDRRPSLRHAHRAE